MTEPSAPGPTQAVLLASAEDFRAADLTVVLASIQRSDERALELGLRKAAEAAEVAGLAGAARAYHLLAAICTFHLRVEDQAEVWGPRWQAADGRSYTASDFRGEQTDILADVAANLAHPSLRARVADVVWYNDRKRGQMAMVAIEAYAEIVQQRLAGKLEPQFPELGGVGLDLVDLVHRALQLVALSQKKKATPDCLCEAHRALYDRSRVRMDFVPFARLARLGLSYGLMEDSEVAPDAERLAAAGRGAEYAMARQEVWTVAAASYRKLGDVAAERRCNGLSVDETLRMRDQVGGASAKAYWTRKAIGELRSAGGFHDRIASLRTELRELQEASLDEFGSITTPMDLSEERQGTIALFGDFTLPDALLQFAICETSPTVEYLRDEALKSQSRGFFASMFGGSYADHEGKVIAETAPAPFDQEPSRSWIDEQSQLYLSIRRQHVVAGVIEPARRVIVQRFPVQDRHFWPIVAASPFVPPGYEHLFALGFARMWQGDFGSAAYLLIPQLENSIRHVLLNSSADTSKIMADLIQEDRSLSAIIESARLEMERVFGADLTNEIDLLFVRRPGPALRHEMAHGKMTAGVCYSADAIYACWLIYQLTCLPLVAHWKGHIAPGIEAALQ